jgi:hypothetical protein
MDPTRDILASSRIAFHPKEHVWLRRQPSSAQLSAFYELWCSREALYKLMPHFNLEKASSLLLNGNGGLAYNGCGWHRYNLSRSGLTVIIASDRQLPVIQQVEIARLRRADWLVAEKACRYSKNSSSSDIPDSP